MLQLTVVLRYRSFSPFSSSHYYHHHHRYQSRTTTHLLAEDGVAFEARLRQVVGLVHVEAAVHLDGGGRTLARVRGWLLAAGLPPEAVRRGTRAVGGLEKAKKLW